MHISKHSLVRLKITVGCRWCAYPSIHVETLKITVGCRLRAYPSTHFFVSRSRSVVDCAHVRALTFSSQDHGRLSIVRISEHSLFRLMITVGCQLCAYPSTHFFVSRSRSVVDCAQIRALTFSSQDHGRLSIVRISEHSLFRLKITVGCRLCAYPSTHFFVSKSRSVVDCAHIRALTFSSQDHGRLSIVRISEHSLFRLKITVGCQLCAYPRTHFFVSRSRSVVDCAHIRALTFSSQDHGRLSIVRISEHTLFRLKIAVGCRLCANPSTHFFVSRSLSVVDCAHIRAFTFFRFKITVSCQLCAYPSTHFFVSRSRSVVDCAHIRALTFSSQDHGRLSIVRISEHSLFRLKITVGCRLCIVWCGVVCVV